MAQTVNLKLPLIDASMTADIPRDMNALAEAVDTSVTEALADVTVPDATTTQKGIVQLNDTLTSTNKTQAATADALRRVYDEALAGKQLGIEQKANVVAALNSIGVSATTNETWPQLIAKISAVIRATGNAVAADVLSGKTFSNASGNNLTGTMANRGAGGTVTPGTTNQSKVAGYYSSAITILGEPNLIASNIRSGVSLFGVTGSLIDRKYATGTLTSGNSSTSFYSPEGTTVSLYSALCSVNFGFVPKFVLIMSSSYSVSTGTLQGAYNEELKYSGYSLAANGFGDRVRVDGVRAYVRSDGFLLPVGSPFLAMTWHVFG
jgi:hypothetical protein